MCGQVEVPAQLSNVLIEKVYSIVELQLVLTTREQWKPGTEPKSGQREHVKMTAGLIPFSHDSLPIFVRDLLCYMVHNLAARSEVNYWVAEWHLQKDGDHLHQVCYKPQGHRNHHFIITCKVFRVWQVYSTDGVLVVWHLAMKRVFQVKLLVGDSILQSVSQKSIYLYNWIDEVKL